MQSTTTEWVTLATLSHVSRLLHNQCRRPFGKHAFMHRGGFFIILEAEQNNK